MTVKESECREDKLQDEAIARLLTSQALSAALERIDIDQCDTQGVKAKELTRKYCEHMVDYAGFTKEQWFEVVNWFYEGSLFTLKNS